MQSFFRVLSDWILPTVRRLQWPPCRTEESFVMVPIVLPVCPPLYLMFILWVLGVKIRYVICLFVFMSAVTGRTRVNWRYRTLKARCDLTMRCMAMLTASQSHSNQSVCVTDTDLPSFNELIPSVQVQSDSRVWCPRRPPRRLAYRTLFICKLR